MHVITAPLDPNMDWRARGILKNRLADEWRVEQGSTEPVGVDLLPVNDAR